MLTVVIATPTGDRCETLEDYGRRSYRENQEAAMRAAGAVPVAPTSPEALRAEVVWVLPDHLEGGARG